MHRLRTCLYGLTLVLIALVNFRAVLLRGEDVLDASGNVVSALPEFPPPPPSVDPAAPLVDSPIAGTGFSAVPPPSPFLLNSVPRFSTQREHFHWRSALRETFEFDTLMHLKRLTDIDTIPYSGRGNVFVNYIRSVEGLHGWDDHDRFVVQYVQHSFQGATDSRIELQNNPNGRSIEWGDPGYWHSRLVAMAWNGFWGAQFKIGPYSEAMIGNVGLPNHYRKRPIPPGADYGQMAWSEFVVNPVFGTCWVITEDLLDRYVARRLEYRGNNYLTYTVRSILTPSRGWANLLRFRPPWYRQSRSTGDFPR